MQASLGYFLRPLKTFLDDESVSEIMVNGPNSIYIERAGRLETTDATFPDEAALKAAARNIAQFVGRSISDDEPLLDGRLRDGSRICIVFSPIADGGTSINIRRFSRSAVHPDFLLERKAITAAALETVLLAVQARRNIIVSGGTGSGKTTLLNVLSTAFSDDERIVVIEDTRELQIQKSHVVQLEARPEDPYGRGEITIRDLFVKSLRMRPDRIVVGEVRRGEAVDMIQAMTSGHRGSLATLHANTPADACRRLETMALMADVGLPLNALRSQIASAIDLIVQTVRLHSGRRLISHISEVFLDEQKNVYDVRDLFALEERQGEAELVWTGYRSNLADEIVWHGLADQVEHAGEVLLAPKGPAK